MPSLNVSGRPMTGWPVSSTSSRERVRSDFATVASHQLRTPISIIRWALDMLLSGRSGRLTIKQREYLDRAYQQNSFMARLVGDLLRISRIEEGGMSVVYTRFSLAALTRSVLREVLPLAKAYNCTIRLNIEPGVPVIASDPLKIKEVIQVLVDNAIRYGKREGKVEVGLTARSRSVVLTVRDHGIGIPVREQKNIFSKFFRGESAIRSQTEGLGVQLYIVKSYVTALGGSITFRSAHRRGTTFILTLPRRVAGKRLVSSTQPPSASVAGDLMHLARHLNDCVILMDPAFQIVMANGNARRLLGLPDDVHGRYLGDVIEAPEVQRFLVRRHFSDESFSTALRLPGDDRRIPFRFLLFPLRDKDIIAGWALVITEGTQHHRADVAAAERIRREREFVSITVHELNGPLSVNKWSLDMLRRGYIGKLNVEQNKLVDQIYYNNERQLILVKDLLNLARLQQGRFSVNIKPTRPGPVVQEVISDFQTAARAKQVRIYQNAKRTLPPVLGDAARVSQVLGNLMSNAIKYSRPRGFVKLSVRKMSGTALRQLEKRMQVAILHTDAPRGYLVFSVQDDGIGIPPNQLRKLFTMFFRSQTVLKLKIEGTGLGLYIAKAIVDLHHGDIWCTSVQDHGSTFSFSLPAA